MERAFQQVDVFTAVPFKGNPVAVVLEGDDLSQQQMQAIASWTNLSETTFVCTPSDRRADYRLRIFTPQHELPFAGHPTIGSAHAVLRQGRRPRTPGRLVQECGKGLIDISIEGDRVFFALPEPQFQHPAPNALESVADALGVPMSGIRRASIVDVGPVWFTVEAGDADAVLALAPDMSRLAALGARGIGGVTVFGLYREGAGAAVEVRAFAPAEGVPEDPVCGSGNGCVAALIRRDGLLAGSRYIARQGRCLGRDGWVSVRFDDGVIWLGGHAVTCMAGSLCV
ncbi:MAG TPA: PhzF family phenazine biosynthesis protein [Acetobacteraceae bacterium]|nr:PhzF family phenazine biosynthesis protein [Acetobacteraceae bacterium]